MGDVVRTIKRGDTAAPIEAVLEEEVAEGTPGAVQDADGSWWKPVDLSLVAEVKLRMRAPHRVVIAGPVTVLDAAAGRIRYAWELNDLAAESAPGSYETEAELTYTDGRIETVPNRKADNPVVQVDVDLDPTAAELAAGDG
ncbi:MAG TPA: hypothetical protein VFR97_10285 [Capillimicrobium sp.]|nr:hypothetical protein [Capillimicrobium sp.]